MIKVRYNLGRGENYMKWKVQSKIDGVEYYAPEDVQLVLHNCTLKNNKKLAKRIFEGQSKDVCAWIHCESITINHINQNEYYIPKGQVEKLLYNPKVVPFWRFESDGFSWSTLINLDGCNLSLIFTDNKNLYVEIK